MISKYELEKTYSSKLTVELMEIVTDNESYTDMAIEVATEEIKRRGISKSDLTDYVSQKIVDADEQFKNANYKEITFFEKLIFYFFGVLVFQIPFVFHTRNDYLKEKGYILKIKQGRYFMIRGLILLVVIIMVNEFIRSNFILLIWPLGFLIIYFIERRISKKRRKIFENLYDKQDAREFY